MGTSLAAATVRDPRANARRARDAIQHLVVLAPDGATPIALPQRGELLIGRDIAAHVRLPDPGVSRLHARIAIGEGLTVEDLGSANGTFLRDQALVAHAPMAFAPGDAIAIGGTVLLVQSCEPGFAARRLWSHAYFETRLIEASASAQARGAGFAIARLQVEGDQPAADVIARALAEVLGTGDVLAAYAPSEYEVLVLDPGGTRAGGVAAAMTTALAAIGLTARCGLASCPADGTAPQVLVARAAAHMRSAAAPEPRVVVLDDEMRALNDLASRAAAGNSNVLILGETGVGKEVLAQAVHRRSSRANGPFLPLNCAAFSESLVEGELFGYERGAFTGAAQAKAGLLEAAAGGTLFLDEIGEMPLSVQAKLLRVIEARQVLRIGALKPRPIDVRLVAATNRDLEEEVAAKRFREDLYFRLNVIALEIPPLRQRPAELEALVTTFLQEIATSLGRRVPALAPAAQALLRSYAWPGNIRELRNVLERASILCTGGIILPEHLPRERMLRAPWPANTPAVPAEAPPPAPPPVRNLEELERQAIADALARCHWNQTRAAELLGMPRRTFCRRLTEYGIRPTRAA